MSSDNINLISYTQNISSGQTAITDPVLLSQYISLSIVGRSDVDLAVSLQFSGDGVNFDYSTTSTLLAGANIEISSPVLAKWTRLSITNNSLVNSTFLRLYVYASPSNSSIKANISKLGNYNPEIDVGNLERSAFGDLRTTRLEAHLQMIYNRGTDGNIYPPTFVYPQELKTYSSDGTGTLQFLQGNLLFGNNVSASAYCSMWSSYYSYRPGLGMTCRFTLGLNHAVNITGNNPPIKMFCGMGNQDINSRPLNGIFVGFSGTGDWMVDGYNNSFGIVYINNGTTTFIPRQLWNIDKADGTFKLPVLDFSMVQLYEMSYAYLGYGEVIVKIYNPVDKIFQPVHKFNICNVVPTSNPKTNFSDPTFSMLMYYDSTATTPTGGGNCYMVIGSYALFQEGNTEPTKKSIGFQGSRTGVSAETEIISLRGITGTWYNRYNHQAFDIKTISASVDGTKNARIRIYRGGTFGAGAVWTSPYLSQIPVEVNTTPAYNLDGTLVYSFELGKVDDMIENLEVIHLHCNYWESYTVTCQSSANTDCYISLSTVCH